MTNVLSTIGPVTENISNLKKIVKHSKFVGLMERTINYFGTKKYVTE